MFDPQPTFERQTSGFAAVIGGPHWNQNGQRLDDFALAPMRTETLPHLPNSVASLEAAARGDERYLARFLDFVCNMMGVPMKPNFFRI